MKRKHTAPNVPVAPTRQILLLQTLSCLLTSKEDSSHSEETVHSQNMLTPIPGCTEREF